MRISLVSALLAMLIAVSDASACSCRGPDVSVSQYAAVVFQGAGAIVIARFVSLRTEDAKDTKTATVEAIETIKGPKDITEIHSRRWGSTCGITFYEGPPQLFILDKQGFAHACSNYPWFPEEQLLQELRKLAKHS